MSTISLAEIDDLYGVGQLVTDERTVMSPLRGSEGTVLTEEQTARLLREGILDASGAITREHAPTFTSLARASAAAKVELAGTRAFEYAVYFDSAADSPVSLIGLSDALRIDDPAQTDAALEYLANAIGTSVWVGTEFEIELKSVEALVLSTAIDDLRRRLLRSLADGELEPEPPGPMDLERALVGPSGRFIGLAPVVHRALESATVDEDAVEEALVSLARAGHIHEEGPGFSPTSSGRALANNMLSVEGLLSIQAGRMGASGTPRALEHAFLVAGLHGLVSVDFDGEVVRMEAVSSSTVLKLAEAYLTDPRALISDAVPA